MNQLVTAREPIAIVGIGCRFPGGASNPQKFWELLLSDTDCFTDFPADRWDARRFYDPDPDKPGKTFVKQAAFLKESIWDFDPGFFGISHREAASMDPQQRLILEVAWEAIEDGGLLLDDLVKSPTGVFMGAFFLDHYLNSCSSDNRDLLNNYSATGVTLSMLASRISYIFDLHGPCVSMDTACSSSLVAAHFACQSIWNGECSQAFVGGVNVMSKAEVFITLSKGKYISPLARCKAFAEDAAGYARGEGAGVVILKPLSKAIQDKNPIYALIRATGINQDGQTTGITVPNPVAQAELIKRVYTLADVSPAQIQYVEAHGAGTQVGDSAEADALNTALSPGRLPENKCIVGSVKTKTGHLEAASGMAGLVKTVLSLKHKYIPGNLHYDKPNPQIPIDSMCIKIASKLKKWPEHGNQPAMAGVNSFGYGGTNAHVLLEEAPFQEVTSVGEDTGVEDQSRTYFIPLSAKDENALRQMAGLYSDFLETDEYGKSISLNDLAYTLGPRRNHLTCRLALTPQTRQELCKNLRLYAQEENSQQFSAARVLPEQNRKVVFVCTGMGPQWWAMGRELLARETVFRKAIEEFDEAFTEYSGWSILHELTVSENASRMQETQVAQPANFAIQIGLAALLKSWGIVPDAVVGHSVGEVAAAYIAGALSLQDAAMVSYQRSHYQQKLVGQGTMLAVGLSEAEATAVIDAYDDVSIAAFNSETALTLSGNKKALQEIAELLDSHKVFNRFLHVEAAFHSYQMEKIKEPLLAVLAGIKPQKTTIDLFSTVSGKLEKGEDWGANYWWQNVRQPVHFHQAMNLLIKEQGNIFIEIGPHPVLSSYIKDAIRKSGTQGQVVATLHRKQPEQESLFETLRILYTLGVNIDWQSISPDGQYCRLPSYPWQKEYFRIESAAAYEDKLGASGHIFLNEDLRLPHLMWGTELNEQFFPYLKDHCVQNTVVLPGAFYVEAGLAVNEKLTERKAGILENIVLHKALFFDNKKKYYLRFAFMQKTREYSVFSRDNTEEQWTLHASGRILPVGPVAPTENINLAALRNSCPEPLDSETFYEQLDKMGLNYGSSFRLVQQIWQGEDQVLAEIRGRDEAYERDGYLLHPAVLDASFQVMAANIMGSAGVATGPYMPVSIDRISFYGVPAGVCYAYGQIYRQTEKYIQGDIIIFDHVGSVLVKIKGIKCQALASQGRERELKRNPLYVLRWRQAVPESLKRNVFMSAKRQWLVVTERGRDFDSAAECIQNRIGPVIFAYAGEAYQQVDNHSYIIRQDREEDFVKLFSTYRKAGIARILYLRGLAGREVEMCQEKSIELCGSLTQLVKAWIGVNGEEEVNLAVITNGTQTAKVTDHLENLAATPLWGLGRLITNEHPAIKCKLIDVSAEYCQNEWNDVVEELVTEDPTVEVAIRGSERYIRQLAYADNDETEQLESVSTQQPVALKLQQAGNIDSLIYEYTERIPPGPEEIEIQVNTAGLNYKDLLKVMGQLPDVVIDGTASGSQLGMEVAGTVVGFGKNVTGFKIGDPVISAAHGIKSYQTVTALLVGHKPAALSFAQAPVYAVYFTAYYALAEVARIQPGERVLIHSATGGVGLAAIQIARLFGAEIFATAGNQAKREFLKNLGVPHVFDSRTLQFVDDIQALTNGQGVDVVLNSIAGEALLQSVSLLAPNGRFIEIGKKDIAENQLLPLAVFNKGLTFAAIDIDRMSRERPQLCNKMTHEITALFEAKKLSPLPVTLFAAPEIKDAFRYLASNQHIGKVVINLQEQMVPVVAALSPATSFKADGTYLVTGGTRGLGLEIGKWLAANGAGSIVLVSRSGSGPEIEQAVEAMQQNGSQVTCRAVDIADSAQVEKLIAVIKESLPPLRGIFHGAMVLDDGFLVDMDQERYLRVANPKIQGALNLHRYTKHEKLDFFVMLSSISSLIGNVGQAGYVAANAFLDAFSQYRQSRGLPALTVNLGPVAEVGAAARNKGLDSIFASIGMENLPPELILKHMGRLIAGDEVQTGLFIMDFAKWGQVNPQRAKASLFRDLVAASGSSLGDDESPVVVRELLLQDGDTRQKTVVSVLSGIFAKVLRVPSSRIVAMESIKNLGMDSLMAIELQHSFWNELGVEITTMELLKGPSICQLASTIINRLNLPESDGMDDMASRVEAMSEEEVEQEIARLSEAMRNHE